MNPASLTNTFGVIGPCGTLDQVLDQVLGPDPDSCDAQTGPLPGEGSPATSGGGTSSASGSSSTPPPSPQSEPSAGTPTTTPAGGGSEPAGPNSGLGGLSQLLSPLLRGVG